MIVSSLREDSRQVCTQEQDERSIPNDRISLLPTDHIRNITAEKKGEKRKGRKMEKNRRLKQRFRVKVVFSQSIPSPAAPAAKAPIRPAHGAAVGLAAAFSVSVPK